MTIKTTILALALSNLAASAGTTLVDAKGPVTPPPAAPAPRLHPNAHGAHRPTANLATADGLGFQLNLPYESILYYRGNRVGENGLPLSLDMDVKITDTLTWVNNYKFINFIEDDSADTKLHLWTALFYQMGISPSAPASNSTATTAPVPATATSMISASRPSMTSDWSNWARVIPTISSRKEVMWKPASRCPSK